MADNTKSPASLADEATEHYYKSVSEYRSSEYSANAGFDFRAGWEAAAVLRAPTIAADRGIGFAFVLVKRFQELSSAAVLGSFEFNERGKAWLQEAFDYAAALATPSPTIAAQRVVCKCENCKRRWGY